MMGKDWPISVNITSNVNHCWMKDKFHQLYANILHFKDAIINMLLSKGMVPSAELFRDISVVDHRPEINVLDQMASSSQCILHEALTVFSTLLNCNGKDTSTSLSDGLSHGKASVSLMNSMPDDTSRGPLSGDGLSTADGSSPVMESLTKMELENQIEQMKRELLMKSRLHHEEWQYNTRPLPEMEQHVHFVQKELNNVMEAQHLSRQQQTEASHTDNNKQESVILFSRPDIEQNIRVLKKCLTAGRLPVENYESASQAMAEYARLQRVRLRQLVKQYSQHVTLREAKKCLSQTTEVPEPEELETFKRIDQLHKKKMDAWTLQALEFSELRAHLAETMISRLSDIEEESGLFLVKPVVSWKGRPKTMCFKVSTRRRHPVRRGKTLKVPVPSFNMIDQSTEPNEKISPAQPAECLTKSFFESAACPVANHGSSLLPSGRYIQRFWEVDKTQLSHRYPCAKVRRPSLPRILELDLQRVLVPQQRPCIPLEMPSSQGLRTRNNTRTFFTVKHSCPLSAPPVHYYRNSTGNCLPDLNMRNISPFAPRSSPEDNHREYTEQHVVTAKQSFQPLKRFCNSAPVGTSFTKASCM
ncbi:uncharacterized protein LOC136754993 [Amia ocellicauda]|uniref:uncharacterized protein LOC136754993 n=1 Tax=Amia ocellicauda TaxID=2972642 RepID=UPI0034648352